MTTVRQCVATVCNHFGVSEIDVLSDRRSAAVALPRQVAYWLARETTLASFPQIARVLRRADHTTIVYGVRKVDRLRRSDLDFRLTTDRLRDALMPVNLYDDDGATIEDPRQLKLIPGGRIAS